VGRRPAAATTWGSGAGAGLRQQRSLRSPGALPAAHHKRSTPAVVLQARLTAWPCLASKPQEAACLLRQRLQRQERKPKEHAMERRYHKIASWQQPRPSSTWHAYWAGRAVRSWTGKVEAHREQKDVEGDSWKAFAELTA